MQDPECLNERVEIVLVHSDHPISVAIEQDQRHHEHSEEEDRLHQYPGE